jgi:hypothetical protein
MKITDKTLDVGKKNLHVLGYKADVLCLVDVCCHFAHAAERYCKSNISSKVVNHCICIIVFNIF